MRLPINAVPINGSSVNVWADASSSSGAEAFGVAERHAYVDRSVTATSLIAPVVANRAAFQFSSDEPAEAGVVFVPLRTAYQLGSGTGTVDVTATVTRYAWVDFPPSTESYATATIDDSAVIVYAVAFPHPARAVAITWLSESKQRIIKTRPRKSRSVKSARAITRLMPNTAIGFGTCTAEAGGALDRDFIGLQRSIRGSATVTAAVAVTGTRSVKGFIGKAVSQATTDIAPTTQTVGSTYRYSWFAAEGTVEAVAQGEYIRSAWVYDEQATAVCEPTLAIYRHQEVAGASVTAAYSTGSIGLIWHVHRMEREKLNAGALAYSGFTQYRLKWVYEDATVNAATVAMANNLRWVGASSSAEIVGAATATPFTCAYGDSTVTSEVSSRGVNSVIRPGSAIAQASVDTVVTPTKYAYQKATKTINEVIDNAVVIRWAGHGSHQKVAAIASEDATALRITVGDGYPEAGRSATEGQAIRNVYQQSDVSGFANSLNVIEPVRYAKVFERPQGVGQLRVLEEAAHVRSWLQMRGSTVGTAHTGGEGLRIFRVEPAPIMEANASTVRLLFNINATAQASSNRTLQVAAYNRELVIPYSSREYTVQ